VAPLLRTEVSQTLGQAIQMQVGSPSISSRRVRRSARSCSRSGASPVAVWAGRVVWWCDEAQFRIKGETVVIRSADTAVLGRRLMRAVLVCLVAIGLLAVPSRSSAASAVARANSLLARMTLGEELSLVGSGVTGVPRLGIPPLLFSDGPNGVGEGARNVTSFPNAVNIGASFDPALARRYGQALGAETAASGKDLSAAPTINIVRSPLWGRAAETFG
jgi:hypothetical protein